MNFDFSDDLKALGDEVARLLRERGARSAARGVLDGKETYDAALWRELGELGWLGISLPEAVGGSGLGFEGLCILAEQMGRSLAAIPFSSSLYLAGEALLLGGSAEQQATWLPRLANGSTIGTVALMEDLGNPSPDRIHAAVKAGRLTGVKLAVPDGGIADMAIVAARLDDGRIGLAAVDLHQRGVTRTDVAMLDPTRNHARLDFQDAACEVLSAGQGGWTDVLALLSRGAILLAFEQVGGAQACLDMARDYALERRAFGRQIGSFQAIKHKLARVFVDIELARSAAYHGAWAAATSADEMVTAAAVARLMASKAFQHAATENIQTHGGIGFTWEADCHLFYRRAKLLALSLGSASFWSNELDRRILPGTTVAEMPCGL